MDVGDISIEALNLRKTFKVRKRDGGFTFINRYSQIEAVRDISFSIQKGDIVGFIGPNGAGKSTTVKMLTGILMPDDGSIQINGINQFIHYHRLQILQAFLQFITFFFQTLD